MTKRDRVAQPERLEGGRWGLVAPEVGLWREGPREGDVVTPGQALGRIETLGVLSSVLAPEGVAGVVVERYLSERARPPVDRGTVLVILDPETALGLGASFEAKAETSRSSGLVLTAPMGGRFYLRPSPGKPPFVGVGDTLESGQTVGLIEVMKTFNRVLYGGSGLPSPARVKAILVADDEDIEAGRALLEMDPV